MKTSQILAISALAMATMGAFADASSGAPLTRAEVRQSVIDARKAGELIPAGDAADYPAPQSTVKSTLTRSEVDKEVLQARAAGDLIPAGEGDDLSFSRSQPVTYSALTRSDVKTATLQARDTGKLLPAGPFDDSSLAREQAQSAYAHSAWLAHHTSPTVASNK